MQVFYKEQVFVLHLRNQFVARLRTKIKKDRKTDIARCFYLTQDCELHIIPKTREQEEAQARMEGEEELEVEDE